MPFNLGFPAWDRKAFVIESPGGLTFTAVDKKGRIENSKLVFTNEAQIAVRLID